MEQSFIRFIFNLNEQRKSSFSLFPKELNDFILGSVIIYFGQQDLVH